MTRADVGTAGTSGSSTALAQPPPPEAGRPTEGKPGRRRRWRLWILVSAIGLILALIIAGGIGFLVYGKTYQPLGWGDLGGNVSPSLKTIGDGIDDTNLILVGPKGTTGTISYALANNGSHPVRILPGSYPYPEIPVVRLAWEPVMMHGVMGGGTIAEERQFPATIPAHSEISLWITIVQPACSGEGFTTEGQIPIRWSALGWHHMTWLQLGPGPQGFLPIVTCPPPAALRHIQSE